MSQEPKYKTLYKYLKSNNLTDLDEATFLKEYSSNDKKSTELHTYLQSKKLTDLDVNQFKSEYFSVSEKKNDIGSSTTPSTPKESPTPTRAGGTLSVGGQRMTTPPSATSGLPKKTPRATQEELSTWNKSFKDKTPKDQPLKDVITPFGQFTIEDVKLSTPADLELKREERILKEANNIDREAINKAVNDEINNKQFTDGLREGAKSAVNVIATPIYQFFTDSKEEFLKPYVPLEQELKEVEEAYKNSKVKPTEEQKKQEATALFIEKKEAENRISNLDRFINSSSKEYKETQERMNLKELTKAVVKKDRLRQDSNYLMFSQGILEKTPKEIEVLNNRIKESLKKGDTATADNLIAEIDDKEKLFLETAKTTNVIVNRYEDNLKDLKDTQSKIDYLRLNYSTEGKLLDDLYSTSLQIVGGGIKYIAETAFDTRVNEPAKFIADIGSSMLDASEKQIVDRRNVSIDQVNSARDLGLWTAQLFTRQAPILAGMYFGGPAGLALVSTGSGGQKFREMEKEEEQLFGRKYSFAEKWLASTGYAGLEFALEKVGTFKILKDVKKTFKSFPSADQALFRDGFKEAIDYTGQISKASVREAGTELATSVGQLEVIDLGFLDKEISQKERANIYLEALTSGAVMGGGMVGATIPVQVMSKIVAETATRVEIQKSRELLEKMNTYAEELKKPDLTDGSKKILAEKINELTQQSFDIVAKNKKDLENLSRGEIKAILEINIESQDLRDKAKGVLESNISKGIKDIEIASLQQQYDALQDKKSQIRSGAITEFDLQTEEQIEKLKDKASEELTKEAEGKDITLTEEVIIERAKQIYKQQKQKQDERQVPKQEEQQPKDAAETVSTKDQEDGLRTQEEIVNETTKKLEALDGVELINDTPLMGNESSISEAYHKAKEDGSNPELVKAVEELVKPKTDAIQIETTSEVSFQPKTEVGKEVEGGKPKTESQQTTEEKINELRTKEQAELSKALPNAEQYMVDGKVDGKKITDPAEKKIFDDIYDKYDRLITPLLDSQKEVKNLSQKVRNSVVGINDIVTKIGVNVWNEAMDLLANEIENETAIGKAIEKTTDKITELIGNADWGVSEFKKSMKQYLGFEDAKQEIKNLRDALKGTITATQFLKGTRRVEEKNLKTAKNKIVQEIVKRFEGVLPKGAISDIIKAVNQLNSKGDIDSQLDKVVDKINDIINKDKDNVRVKEAANKRKQGIKNFKKGGYSIDSPEAKIIFMNPKIVFKLGEKIFNAYFDALNQITTTAKVSPNLGLSTLKAIYDNNLLNSYIDLATKINEAQLNINERVESLIDSISQSGADVNDLIKDFRDGINDNYKDILEFLDIPSNNELKGVDSDSDTDLIKAEEKEILINLIKDDIKTVVNDIAKITKDVNSKLYQHIKFLEDLINTETGEVFLNSLNNTALNNLYNAVLNLKETNESGFYINELNNKYQTGVNIGVATNVISDASKKGGALDNFFGKVIGKALSVLESVQIIGSSETVKGITDFRQRLMRNLINANLPKLDKILGNDANNNLYKSLFDFLSKAISKYTSIIKPIMNKLDDLQGMLERSKDVEVSNVKLVFHSLSIMKMSNLQNKKIGNIVEHFKHTINYHKIENPEWAKTLQKIYDKHIVPFIVTTDVKENTDGTITIDITAGEGVKDGVTVQTKDETGNVVNQKVKVVNGKGSITIKTPITYNNYLVVTPNNYLSSLEQKVYNETRDILKGIESMSKESMVMQNGRMNQMSENYVPMASHIGGSSNLDKVIDSLISSIDRGLGVQESGTSVPDSGNLLPLQSGNKALKMSYIQNIKGVAKGVALQHSVKDEVGVAVKTARGIMKEAIKSDNETQIAASSAIKEVALIAIKNSLIRTSIPNLIMSKVKDAFYTLALAVVQSRVVDFTLNNLRYAIINPKGYFNISKKGVNRYSQLLKGKRAKSDMKLLSEKIGLTKEETVTNLVKNMKASDSAGLISSDLSSTLQGITSDKTMRADSTKEFYSETAKFFTKVNSIFFKNSIVKFIKGINTIVASISDTALKRDIFFEEFNAEFKKETGEDIDFEKMAKGDVMYISSNQKAINKASSVANANVSIMTGSSNPLERTLRTNIQVGASTLASLKGTATKPNPTTKFIDNVDVLFAGFMRSIYAQYKEGMTYVIRGMKDGNAKQVRNGSASVIAASATVSLYKPIVAITTSAIANALLKAFIYDDEEEEDAERVGKALDIAREDKEMIDLLFRLQQVEDIKGFSDKDTNELKIKEVEFLLNKLYENKAFRDVMVFKTSHIIYESVMLQIKNKANQIAEELIKNPLSTKGRYEVKNYDNPQNIINTLGYLYSEEGSKEPNVEEDRRKMKEYLKLKLLTGTSFTQFDTFLNQFEKEDNGFKNAYILETAKIISKYRTTKEILIGESFSEFLNFNLGGTGGNLGRTIPSLAGHTIEKYIYEESRKPFDDYNPEVVLSENLLDEQVTPRKKSELIGAYVFRKINPATSSVLSKAIDVTDFRDDGVSASKLLSLFLLPGSQDVNKVIKASEKDVKRSMITKDKLKSFMFGKKEKDFEDLDFDMMDISEITRATRDTLRSAGDKKFGGN